MEEGKPIKFFSLEWFKSKASLAVEKVVTKRLDALMELEDTTCPGVKPYLSAKIVNDVLTIVTLNGDIISKPNATIEDFQKLKTISSEYELMDIVGDGNINIEKKQFDQDVKKVRALQKGIDILRNHPEFTIEDNIVYFTGISRSLPEIMVEELIDIVADCEECTKKLAEDVRYLSLYRFFMWCCLNPRAEVAHELYRFLKENSFRITKQGFFVALRNVVTIGGNPELVNFVSNAYNKVKAVWGKNPADYTVFLDKGNYTLVENESINISKGIECPQCDGDGYYYDEDEDNEFDCDECGGTGMTCESDGVYYGSEIGNLTEIYLDLPNRAENRFTDDWTKTFDIRIGRVVSMPMEKCNWSTQDCAAAGLHFTADQIHYVGCGDQSVLMLINPMKIVGIGQHKGRCYEYLPIMTVPRTEATSILHDLSFDTLELDEDYAIRELEGLTEKAKEGFVAESTKYEFNIPQISTVEIRKIATSLGDMKKEISKRVSLLD